MFGALGRGGGEDHAAPPSPLALRAARRPARSPPPRRAIPTPRTARPTGDALAAAPPPHSPDIASETACSPAAPPRLRPFNESGEITSISIYHEGGTGSLLVGVYSDQSGTPASRLGISSSTTISSATGWQTVSLTSPILVNSGQTVWLSWVFQNNPGIRYTTGTPGRAASSYIWSDGMPTNFGTATIASTKYSVYCNYIPKINTVVKTLGYEQVYENVIKWANQLAMPVTFIENGEIKSISIYHDGGTGNFLLGVYSNQSGNPSSRLGITASTVVNSNAGWQTVQLTNPVPVISGQTVWLSWVFQNTPNIHYTTGTP